MSERCALVLSVLVSTLIAAAPASARAAAHPWLKVALRSPARSVVEDAALHLPADRSEAFVEARFGYVELLRRHVLRLEPDGTLHSLDIAVRHFLTDEAVREHGNLHASVSSLLDDLVVEEAWVLSPEGERRSVDSSVLQVTDVVQDGVFSDHKRVVLPFEGLRSGSTAVWVTRTVSHTRRLPLPWIRRFYPEDIVPVERFEVDMRWSAAAEKLVYRSDVPHIECEERASALRCVRQGIPAVPFDPDVRSWPDQLSHLVIAAPQTWQLLAETERRIVDQQAVVDGRVQALAQELTAEGGDPRALFERIHRRVADGIRYVGLEHGRSSVVPNAAASTLRRGFGDCKDKVVLFLALARAAGLSAFAALVSTRHYDRSRLLLPGWHYFDHMIGCVREGEGDDAITCVDLTVPELPTGMLPPSLHGSVALLLDGVATQPTSMPTPEYALEIELHSYNDLECDGSITERLHRQYGGPTAYAIRASLRAQDGAARQRLMRERYEEVMGTRAKSEFEFAEETSGTAVMVLRSLSRYPATQPVNQITTIREGDAWLVDFANQLRTKNQYHPYYVSGLRIASHVYYRICPELNVRFPGPELSFASAYGSLRRRYNVSATRAVIETVLEMPAAELDPTSLAHYHRFLDAVFAQTHLRVDLGAAKRRR